MPSRQFSAYEQNQLRKYGVKDLDFSLTNQEPIEYLTGHATFCGLDFLVNPSTLIPRIESEQVVSIAFSFLKPLSSHHLDIADIGTGSGCLGISIANLLLAYPINNFDLWLSDISDQALKTAQENSRRLIDDHRQKLHFLKSDLLSNFPSLQKFDLVVANLPYIPSARLSTLDPSVKDYEPLTALDGGARGTSIINQLLPSVEKYLKPNFQIILEIDSEHDLSSFTIPSKFHAEIKNDIFERPRFLTISSL